MNPVLKISLLVISAIVVTIVFVLLIPSLIGLVYLLLFGTSVWNILMHRRDQAVRTFNSAVRTVSHHDAGLSMVAKAFAKRGPISGNCYEFVRRLTLGQPAVHAAIESELPLELSTAIALQSKSAPQNEQSKSTERSVEDAMASARVDGHVSPVPSRLMYLTIVCTTTWAALGFVSVMIMPTFEKMFDEFGLDYEPFASAFKLVYGMTPVMSLAIIGILVGGFITRRGHLGGRRLPRWASTSLPVAYRRGEVLRGLADAIDLGWPMVHSLQLAHDISRDELDRHEISSAVQMIQSGTDSATSLYRANLIDETQYAWLANSTSTRAAELLRTAADELVRDAIANGRWIANIVYPVLVVVVGFGVMVFAYSMFGALVSLTNGLC